MGARYTAARRSIPIIPNASGKGSGIAPRGLRGRGDYQLRRPSEGIWATNSQIPAEALSFLLTFLPLFPFDIIVIYWYHMERDVIEAPNLRQLIDTSYEGKWVAISADHQRLIAASDDLLALEREVRGQAAVLFKVLPSDVGYAPYIRAH